MSNEGYGIRPVPGKCCPDADCGYGNFGREFKCKGCGKEHKDCKLYGD